MSRAGAQKYRRAPSLHTTAVITLLPKPHSFPGGVRREKLLQQSAGKIISSMYARATMSGVNKEIVFSSILYTRGAQAAHSRYDTSLCTR